MPLALLFPRRSSIRLFAAPLAGALLLAAVNAADVAVAVPMPPGGPSARALHHLFDLLGALSLGLAAAALLGTIGHALRHHPRAGRVAYLAAGTALSFVVLGQDLRHQADYVSSGALGQLLFALLVTLCGAALPVAQGLGAWASRRRFLRWIGLAIALGGMVASHLVVRDDYPAFHASIEWTAATLAFGSLTWLVARLRSRKVGRAAFTVLAAAGLAGLLIPPPNRTRVQLFRSPGAIGAWAMARTVWPVPFPEAAASAPPPSVPTPAPPGRRFIEGSPVVVMITIDATRSDVVFDRENASVLPFFNETRRNGVAFTRAISPGSQTSVSLSTVFSGRYFSQLYWSRFGKGPSRFLYPAEDPTPRFPELLAKAGVHTALFGGTNFLADDYGVARGFTESKTPEGRRHAMASEVLDPLLDRLSRAGPEPTFLYAHIMEPHHPYDRGKKKGTDLERYVSEVSVADAQVFRVWRALSQRFPTRGLLIVTSDHGEAFGEHGTFQHTKTLYDELLHVPLFIRGAGVKARRVEERVSLVDLGPTILELFGLPAPETSMGQSLVPVLRGEPVPAARPLIAEGRLRRAFYAGQVKVIEDLRRRVVEAYDLDADPEELVNLFDSGDPRAMTALSTLRAFFAANAIQRPGYSPPYKP